MVQRKEGDKYYVKTNRVREAFAKLVAEGKMSKADAKAYGDSMLIKTGGFGGARREADIPVKDFAVKAGHVFVVREDGSGGYFKIPEGRKFVFNFPTATTASKEEAEK